MKSVRSLLTIASAAAFLATPPTAAQTYSNCNPLTQGGCPADSALGRSSVHIDFSSGASDSFTAQGNPTYNSNGVSFTVAGPGQAPQLTSKWYIMFGRVDVQVKAASGVGIVSSVVMQSDDLDEIDWEWLGASPDQVQSNYFGKGQTTTYDRGAFHQDPGSQSGFKTYTIIWTAEQIVWQIDGATVRVLTPAQSNGQYPQTPMQLKIGAWSGGDPSNAPGTIQWAGGPTDYSKGPFSMQVKSIVVSDYSTGSSYQYSDKSGSWQSIVAVGGHVNPGSGATVDTNAPAVTSISSGQPIPFEGTHRGSSTYVTPSVWPWVPDATASASATPTYSNYPGLPSGWSVTSSGKVVPPSSAPLTSPPAASTSSPAALPQDFSSPGAYDTITTYDQQGSLITMTVPAGWSTMVKSYDEQGFLITPAPPASAPTASAVQANVAAAHVQPSAPVERRPASSGTDHVHPRVLITLYLFLLGVLLFL